MTRDNSTFDSPEELPVGLRLPPPFDRMRIASFLRRSETGGYLYLLEIVDDDPDWS
jgi:hypothetical protein